MTRSSRPTPFAVLGFSALFALLTACAGPARPAESPPSDRASDAPTAAGSTSPDPSITGATETTSASVPSSSSSSSAPVNGTAAASTKDDGSDIIPPFPSAGKKSATPTKHGAKKASGKPKKKG